MKKYCYIYNAGETEDMKLPELGDNSPWFEHFDDAFRVASETRIDIKTEIEQYEDKAHPKQGEVEQAIGMGTPFFVGLALVAHVGESIRKFIFSK